MSISASRTTTLSADGLSDWVTLAKGWNRVYVNCEDWSTSSVAVVLNKADDTNYSPAEDSSGSVVVAGSNRAFDVYGPGYIGGVMSTYGGTGVTITATDEYTAIANR